MAQDPAHGLRKENLIAVGFGCDAGGRVYRLPEEVGPIEVTRQGRRDQEVLQIDERADTWGTAYYWFGFARKKSNPPPGTDLLAVYEGRISVTPLVLDLTHRAALEPLAHHLKNEA